MLQSPGDDHHHHHHHHHQGVPSNLVSARDEVNRFTKLLMRTKTIASQRSYGDDGYDDDDDVGSETGPQGGSGADGGGGGGATPQLRRVLTTADLVSLGVGSCCGTGMYVVAGFVARTIAGPAVIVSFIIAAVASILSGVCYCEFGVRVPKTTGSAYMYSYVAVGEFVAFLLGWNMILEYVIGSAAGASAISVCIDALTNHSISSYLQEHIGTVIGKSYPDFVACGVGLLMTAILAAGVRGSVRFNNILNAVNFVVFVFIVITGFFYVDSHNWSDYGFAPNGASGVFTGAATCFYAFIGFDIIGTTGEEAKEPSRSIPVAIISSLCICLFAYVTVSVVLTLTVPYFDVEPGSALVAMFAQRGFYSAQFVVAIGALAALVVSLLGSMFPMPRIIYAMARDGLLFEFLGRIHQRTGTPLVATVLTGTAASVMSLLVSLEILIQMMSIGTLFAYSLVSVSVLLLRYQPDKHDLPIPMAHRTDPDPEEDTTSPPSSTPSYDDDGAAYGLPSGGGGGDGDHRLRQATKRRYKDDQHLIPAAKEDGRAPSSYGSVTAASPGRQCLESKAAAVRRHAKMWWLRLGFPGDDVRPTDRTARTVIVFVGLLCLAELSTCVAVVFGGWRMADGEVWVGLLVAVFLAAVVACIVVILRQPQNKCKVDFKAPFVPFLPSVAVFVNLYLALNLPALTWMRLGVWICVGLLLYFGYSMVHSVKAQKSSQGAAPPLPPPSLPGDQSKKQEGERSVASFSQEGTDGVHVASGGPQVPPQNVTTSDHNNGQNMAPPPRRPPPPRQESLTKLRATRVENSNPWGAAADPSYHASADRTPIYQPKPRSSGEADHGRSASREGLAAGRMEEGTRRVKEPPQVSGSSSSSSSAIARPRPRPSQSSNVAGGWGGGAEGEDETGNSRASNPFREYREIGNGAMRSKNPFRE